MRYVGLTDQPERRRAEHGHPPDWRVEQGFANEEAARKWERAMIIIGYQGGTGGAGWRYGYTYTITEGTRQ
jgi:hypothetical protein